MEQNAWSEIYKLYLSVVSYAWCFCCVFLNLQRNRVFHITTLIVPKQESTSDSVRWILCFIYRDILDLCLNFTPNIQKAELTVLYDRKSISTALKRLCILNLKKLNQACKFQELCLFKITYEICTFGFKYPETWWISGKKGSLCF